MKTYGCLNNILYFWFYRAENMISLHYKGQPINTVKANTPNSARSINTL